MEMEIKISLGADLYWNSHVLRVDLYKSIEAMMNPIDHPHECFNYCAIVDLSEPDKIKLLKNILNVVEISVTSLLNHKPELSDEDI